MKKFLGQKIVLLCVFLFGSVGRLGLMAQSDLTPVVTHTVEVNASTGSISGNTWTYTHESGFHVTISYSDDVSNRLATNGNDVVFDPRLHRSWGLPLGDQTTYTINTNSSEWAIIGYSIRVKKTEGWLGTYLIPQNQTAVALTTDYQTFSIEGINTTSTSFTVLAYGLIASPKVYATLNLTLGKLKKGLTYIVYNSAGTEVARKENVDGIIGAAPSLPVELRRGFCTYSYDTNQIKAETSVVRVYYTVNAPFEFSTTGYKKWYNIQINDDRYLYTNNNTLSQINTKRNNETDVWSFEGDPYNLSIVNKAGKRLMLSRVSSWNLFGHNAGSNYFVLRNSTNQFFHQNSTSSLNLVAHDDVVTLDGVFNYLVQSGEDYVPDKAYALKVIENNSSTVRVNYIVMMDGEQVDQVSNVETTVGNVPYLPESNRKAYCLYDDYYTNSSLSTPFGSTIQQTDNGKTIYVKADFDNKPFVRTTDKANPVWQYLLVNDKYAGAVGHDAYPLFANIQIGPMYQWAFVGNPYVGFEVYNRWYGLDVTLCNKSGAGGNSDASYSSKIGPRMDSSTTTWNIVKRSDKVFGFVDKDHEYMSISDTFNEGHLGFYYVAANEAVNSANSRLSTEQTIENGGEATDARLSAINSALTSMVENAGNPYAFTNAAAQQAASLSGTEAENMLNDPANYEKLTAGYYRFKCADAASSGRYLEMISDLAEKEVLYAQMTMTDKNASQARNAGSIFHIGLDNDGMPVCNGILTCQGYTINPHLLVLESNLNSYSGCTSTIYPWGGAAVALQTDHLDDTGDRYVVYDEVAGVRTADYVNMPNLFLLERVSELEVKLNSINNSAQPDPYSYATICVPFDVEMAEHTFAYVAKREKENSLIFNQFKKPGEVLQAGTPVLIVNEEREASAIFAINGFNPSNRAENGNLLSGQYLTFVVHAVADESDVDAVEEHDRFYAFGKGGSLNVAGFYPFALGDSYKVGPNKSYFYRTTSSGAKISEFFISFDEIEQIATSIDPISLVEEEHPDYVYTLQGIRLNKPEKKGVYIINGKKAVIK